MQLFLTLKVTDRDLSDTRFAKLFANMERKGIEYHAVPPNQLNINLIGLGDMGRYAYIGLKDMLKEIAHSHPPFYLKLMGLWAYPYQEEAEMLWIGVQNSRSLRSLQDDVARVLNVEDDHLLRPHIPFLYFKNKTNVSDLISPFKKFDFGVMRVDEIKFLEQLSGLHYMRFLTGLKLGGYEEAPLSHI